MQLYDLVMEFGLRELVTEELRDDCRHCGPCRYLLASTYMTESSSDEDSDSSVSDVEGMAVRSGRKPSPACLQSARRKDNQPNMSKQRRLLLPHHPNSSQKSLLVWIT